LNGVSQYEWPDPVFGLLFRFADRLLNTISRCYKEGLSWRMILAYQCKYQVLSYCGGLTLIKGEPKGRTVLPNLLFKIMAEDVYRPKIPPIRSR